MHDHHKLGRELGLFDTDPLIGSGLRRLDARPAAEVLAQIGALVAAHRVDLWDLWDLWGNDID